MIYWCPRLLVDEAMEYKAAQVGRCIRQKKRQRNVFCILLPQNSANLFEIMNVNELLFPYYQRKDIYMVGLAKGRKSAVRLVCRLISGIYKEGGQDIRCLYSDYSTWKQEPGADL